MRPRMMYIDAANSAGARRSSSDCMMYGPSAQISFVDRMRPIIPIISTAKHNVLEVILLKEFGRLIKLTYINLQRVVV
jgi:hypothetical protein